MLVHLLEHSLMSADNSVRHKAVAKKRRCKPRADYEIDFIEENGSGGGTRTPDTRIMIPLL